MKRRSVCGLAAGMAAFWLAVPTLARASVGEKAEAGAPTANIRSLGQPCQARNVLAAKLIHSEGKDWFVLANMSDPAGLELIFIDPVSGAGQVYRAPAGQGSWALLPVSGERLIVGTFYDGTYLVFDLKSRTFIKSIKFPGEQYFWNASLGGDGRAYGGTYPGGKLGALDLNTYTIEDLGNPAKPNLYLRGVYDLPDGRLFCHYGEEKPENFVFDIKAKSFTPAPDALQAIVAGASWNGYFLAGDKAYRMPDLAAADPLPFPVPDPKNGAWSVEPKLTNTRTLVLRQGSDLFRFRVGDTGLARLAHVPTRGLFLYGIDEQGDLFGVRGQDYTVIHPGDTRITLARIPGESAPRTTMFLRADDHGRLWGGPTFGQTLFCLDTKTGKVINTGTISDHSGEVYDVAVVNGAAYAVAYVFGEIIRYDPSKPWDQLNNINPRRIAKVSPDYIRPAAGIVAGPDGKLYSGWWAKYGSYGGALAITDPKSGETQVVKEPLGQAGLSALALAGKTVLLGSTIRGNGLPEHAGLSATFGIYDPAAGKTVYTQVFDGAKTVASIAYDPATSVAGVLIDGHLRLFDTAKQAFLDDSVVMPPDKITCGTLVASHGRLLYGCDNVLWARDFKTGVATPIATLPARIERITASPSGDIYVACGTDVYAVKLQASL